MKQTKAQFKCALRQCKRQTRTIFADRLADSMHRKNDTDFWRDIHNSTNSAIKLPNVVDTVQGNGNITSMWKTDYELTVNMLLGTADVMEFIMIYVMLILLYTNLPWPLRYRKWLR